MTRFWSSLRCLLALWLWPILTVFAPSAAYAYDFQQSASVSYDGTINAVLRYDAGSVLAGSESARQFSSHRIFSVNSAKFLAAEDSVQIGYHATNPGNVDSILANGFNESQAGRLGGGGVYVNDTQEGAIAEYMAHNPGGPAPTVLQVQYNPGLNYQVSLPTVPSTTGPLRLAADTITAPSVRLPGTFNTIIRNGTAVPIQP
jgi:hypothetical protein